MFDLYCAEFDTRRLFFHLSAEMKSFSVLTENEILKGGPASRICDITIILNADPGPICNLHKRDV